MTPPASGAVYHVHARGLTDRVEQEHALVFIFIATNFFVDLLYAAIDPRRRLDRARLGTAGG